MSKFLSDKFSREQVDTDFAIWLRAIAVALEPIFGDERVLGLLGLHEPGAVNQRPEPDDAFSDSHSAPKSWQINVDRFPMAWLVADFYRFATRGEWNSSTDITDAATDAAKFLDLMESSRVSDEPDRRPSDGDENGKQEAAAMYSWVGDELDRRPSGALQAVLRAGLLRWRIHDQGDDLLLSLQEVAHLAGVAEKTVRLNTDKKLADRLPTSKAANGRDVLVAARDAIAWIDRKFGFLPTRITAESPLDVLLASKPAKKALMRELQQVANAIYDGNVGPAELKANPLLADAVARATSG